MSIPDALDLEVHRAQHTLDLAENESRIRLMTTHPAPLPPDFYTKTMETAPQLGAAYAYDVTLRNWIRDAEAAIANLIVLNDDAIKSRDLAIERRDAAIKSRDIAVASEARLIKERDEARAEAARAQHKVMTEIIPLTMRTLGCGSGESVNEAAARVVKERDERDAAISDLARLLNARPGESILDAAARLTGEHLNAVNAESRATRFARAAILARDVANERARDYETLYKAILAREVDRLKSEKADRIEASAGEPKAIKVGDRVVSAGECATVIGFFTSIAGVEFLAVETMLRGGLGRPYFWRRDLCNPAPVNT